MSTQSAPFYWLVCDYPGCGVKSTEDGEYSAWSDAGQAVDDATSSDWLSDERGDYCPEHWVYTDDEDSDSMQPLGTSWADQLNAVHSRVTWRAEQRARSISQRLDRDGRDDRYAMSRGVFYFPPVAS